MFKIASDVVVGLSLTPAPLHCAPCALFDSSRLIASVEISGKSVENQGKIRGKSGENQGKREYTVMNNEWLFHV